MKEILKLYQSHNRMEIRGKNNACVALIYNEVWGLPARVEFHYKIPLTPSEIKLIWGCPHFERVGHGLTIIPGDKVPSEDGGNSGMVSVKMVTDPHSKYVEVFVGPLFHPDDTGSVIADIVQAIDTRIKMDLQNYSMVSGSIFAPWVDPDTFIEDDEGGDDEDNGNIYGESYL